VEQPAIDFELTVKTTSNVLEFMRVHSPDTQLIYLSSAAVYGQVEAQPITEEAALKPVSPYGLHKQMSESLCQLYSRQFGVSVTIVRLFSIYGEGLRKQLLWDACQKFERGESEFFGTGEEVRDWLHVKDVAGLLFAVAENVTTPYPVINAGSGDGVTVSEILQYVSEQLGLGLKPRFTSRPKVGDPNVYIADVIKARSCGWEPKINWRKGVEDYVDWYKKCR
jgi:UDP-glucose 4-epimerase